MVICLGDHFDAEYFPFIVKISDRVPHLEYFTIDDIGIHYWKRVGKEWVVCDKAESTSSNP
jgi:hypothetical protein